MGGAGGREWKADVTDTYLVLMSFPFYVEFSHLASCTHNRADYQEEYNFSFEILIQRETYILPLVSLRVAEIIEIFKTIYTNH